MQFDNKVKYIFVSSHRIVREELRRRGMHFTLIFPSFFVKEEYINRFKERGSSQAFIDKILSNWDKWITECHLQPSCTQVVLYKGEYLSYFIKKDQEIKIYEK